MLPGRTLEVTAEQLEAAAQRVLARGARAVEHLRNCRVRMFRGFLWQLYLQVKAAEGGLMFGVYVEVRENTMFARGPGQWIRCSATDTACQDSPGAGARPRRPSIPAKSAMQHIVGVPWGWRDFFLLGSQAGWDAAAWAAKGLLLEGGKVVRVLATLKAPRGTLNLDAGVGRMHLPSR